MKFCATFLKITFILFTISLNANEVEFALSEGQKVKSTYSGDIDQKSSIHLIIYKDKNQKQYGIKPFFIDKDSKIIELNDLSFSTEPTILSYHKNEGNLTIISTENTKLTYGSFYKKLTITDINLNSKESSTKVIPKFKAAKITIRLTNKTILLDYLIEEKKINLTNIIDSGNAAATSFQVSNDNYGDFRKIFSSKPQFINTNEYIENGSINETKVYYDDGKLYFDHLHQSKQSILSLILDMEDNGTLHFSKHNNLDSENIKDLNSFYHNGNLYIVSKTKENTKLTIIELKTGIKKFNKTLQKNFIGYFNEKNLEIIDKAIRKSMYKPTITVNKSIEGHNILRLSYVDKTTYYYHHDWWFHHWMFQNMMQQQQQFMRQQNFNRTPGFGPNNENIDVFNFEIKPTTKENEFIIIVFDDRLTPLENASVETIKKYIDKDLHLEPLKDQKGIKHLTAAFSKNTMRTIHYQKKSKKFVLSTTNL